MFQRTRVKLTLWYLVIAMLVSVLFSMGIYTSVNAEFKRFEKIEEIVEEHQELGIPIPGQVLRSRVDPDMIEEARARLISTLVLINLGILAAAGAAGYFLAGRMLRPIQEMVEEQHRFVTDASHELRTPLTSLRSEIEVSLRSKKLTLPEAEKLLQSNLEEVKNLQILSDYLLELAANGNPVDASDFQQVSLEEVIEATEKKLNGSLKKKNITLEKENLTFSLVGIKERLEELFVILLDNAVKYSPQNSTISISAEHLDTHLRINVLDEGVGIAKRDLPHIFDRFYRASNSRSKEHILGYGLGLSIAKKIVESHKGTITVVSTLNKGTTFTIVLPIQ